MYSASDLAWAMIEISQEVSEKVSKQDNELAVDVFVWQLHKVISILLKDEDDDDRKYMISIAEKFLSERKAKMN